MEDAMRVLRLLREAQNNIILAGFDLDDTSELDEALTAIGNVMGGISTTYGLPIISEQ